MSVVVLNSSKEEENADDIVQPVVAVPVALAVLGETKIENMFECENVIINRLGGSDPELRKCVITKLENWLKALFQRCPAPAAAASEDEYLISKLEANFLRIWKSLFCSVWVAVENNLPEIESVLIQPIIALVSILSGNPTLLQLYQDQFFVTLIHEWFWIQSREDSFIMFIRLFIRRLFQEFVKYSWEDSYSNPFINTVDIHILNHHPPPPRSTRNTSKVPIPTKAPPTLQIQVVRIILEELKVIGNGESIPFQKIVAPFVKELAESEDEGLRNEIDYQIRMYLLHDCRSNSDENASSEPDTVEILGGTLGKVDLGDDKESNNKSTETNEVQSDPVEKDKSNDPPSVSDAALINIPIHYAGFLSLLKDAARKTSKRSNKTVITALVQKFQSYFPFTLHDGANETEKTSKGKKNRQTKRITKKVQNKVEPIAFELMDSVYLNDPDLLHHPFHNYISYLVEMEQHPYLSSLPSSPQSTVSSSNQIAEPEPCNIPATKETVKRRLDFGTVTNEDAEEIEMYQSNGIVSNPRKRKNPMRYKSDAERIESNSSNDASAVLSPKFEVEPPKRSKLNKVNMESPLLNSSTDDIVNSSFTSLCPSAFRKSVCIVLAKNVEHEHSDYNLSIQRIPCVFDANRIPEGAGLLKLTAKASSIWKKVKGSYKTLEAEGDAETES